MKYRTWPVGLLAIALVTAAGVRPALAEITRADLRVDGLTCPICAKGVEKALKHVPGIGDAKADLQHGVIHLIWKPGVPFNEPRLKDTVVNRGGYAYREAILTADGVLSRWQDRPALKVTGTDQLFVLLADPSAPAGLERLLKAAGNGQKIVELTGKVHSHAPAMAQAAPAGLMVRSFRLP